MINHEDKRVDHEKYGSLVGENNEDDENNAEDDSAKNYVLTVSEILAIKNKFHIFALNR